MLGLEVKITQKETGVAQTEYSENLLNFAMQRSVELKDLTPIVTTTAAMCRALTKPVEFEVNDFLVQINTPSRIITV